MDTGRQRRRSATATAALALAGALLAGCAGPPAGGASDAASEGAAASPSVAACPAGDPTKPPTVSDLRLASGAAIADLSVPPELTVPFTGSGLVELSVATDTAGAPVTFSATTGHLVEQPDTPTEQWLAAPRSLTVYSGLTPSGECRASAQLAITEAGRTRVTVSAANAQSFVVRVITVPEAARTVDVVLPRGKVLSGARVEGLVRVRDGFGNPIFGMQVEVSVSGPGRLLPRGTTTTVTTDARGEAPLQLGASREGEGALRVRARLTLGGCATSVADGASVGLTQVECPQGVPVPGFDIGQREDAESITVARPSAELLEPATDLELTQGEVFDVVARTTGVAAGTQATLVLGEDLVATAEVVATAEETADGEVRLQTTANLDPAGGGYRLLVDGTEPVVVPVEVKPFAITLVTRTAEGLVLQALPGALPDGAVIRLLRGEREVATATVDIPSVAVTFTVPLRPGVYNVAATTATGAEVLGATPQTVAR